MSQAAIPVATWSRRPRWRVVGMTIGVVAAVAVVGAFVVPRVIRWNEDPFEKAPQLGQQVWEYTMVPLVGTTSTVGKVEVVTMAVTRLEGGRWGVHLVLQSEGGLPRYSTQVTRADGVTTESTCAASGASGWAECYVALSGAPGSTVDMDLFLDREVLGRFPIHLEPWGSAD